MHTPTQYDAIIIGGGHNGLICANYLAKAKKSVLVLEARPKIGGAAASEQVFPGYTFSRFSYVFSIFRQKVVDELFPAQWRDELVLYKTDPSMFIPTEEVDNFLIVGGDRDENIKRLTQFSSASDAENYYQLMDRIAEIARLIEPLWDYAPIHSLMDALKFIPKTKLPKQQKLDEVVAFLTAPASSILDEWFEDDRIKAALSYAGTVGQQQSPYSPGSAFLLLHHVSNTLADPQDGVKYRYYPRGGMGSVPEYLANIAREKGVDIRTNSPVAEILVEDGKATGVRLQDGTEFTAPTLVTNCTYEVTFKQMLDPAVQDSLPSSFKRGMKSIPYETNCSKINLVLDSVPDFTCLKNVIPPSDDFTTKRNKARQYMHNTLMVGDSMQDLHKNYLLSEQKAFAEEPNVQMLMPSLMDDSLTPENSEDIVALLFCQYTPYDLEGGWSTKNKDRFVTNVLNKVERFAPGFKSSVKHIDALSPPDIEKILNMTGGNIFHGSMSLSNLYTSRPMPRHSQYQTPIENLFSCSSANHPGGGVCGGPGRNCAKAVLKS